MLYDIIINGEIIFDLLLDGEKQKAENVEQVVILGIILM